MGDMAYLVPLQMVGKVQYHMMRGPVSHNVWSHITWCRFRR